jgi:hypothetical protein
MKKIVVYDMDKTLLHTPEKTQENLEMWLCKHPNRKFGSGWWGNINSMCSETFDIKAVEHVKEQAIIDIQDVDTFAVLVTGRIPKFERISKEILRKNGIPYFNAYHFNNTHRTLDFKLGVFNKLRSDFPEATHFTIWEDRVDHIPHFEAWGKKFYGSNFTLHVVG